MAEKILEVCKVTPPLGSATDMCLPLTFFDLLWLRHPPVELLFFYDSPFPPETFFSFILPKLKHSLSQTLQHFLPVAGNLMWSPSSHNPVILYQKGDGIILTIAQSDADFAHLSSNNFRESNILQPFKAKIDVSDSQASLFAVKATLFPNKGFCIGITEHHTVFDGKSFTMFINTWASFSKYGEIENLNPKLKPMFDRNIIRECYHGIEKLYINAIMKQNGAIPRSLSTCNLESPPNDVVGAFQLSGSDVKELKAFVRARFRNHNHLESKHDFYISSFTVTFAYLIVCLVKAKKLPENICLSIVVDCRGRLEPPIPPNYFGNCIGFIYGYVEKAKLMGDDGLINAVDAINRTMKSLDDGIMKEAEKWLLIDTFAESEKRKLATRITFSGSTRLDLYNIDFGLGKPQKYFNSSVESGAIGLVEGRDGDGGIEIELCLSNEEMEKFAYAFAQRLTKINTIKAAL